MQRILFFFLLAVGNVLAQVEGDSTRVNGGIVPKPNFNNSTPSPPAQSANVRWQRSGSNISAYLDTSLFNTHARVQLTGQGYLSLNGQTLTANFVNLGVHVTGNLPMSRLAGGLNASQFTFLRGDGLWISPVTGIRVESGSLSSIGTVRLLNGGGVLISQNGNDITFTSTSPPGSGTRTAVNGAARDSLNFSTVLALPVNNIGITQQHDGVNVRYGLDTTLIHRRVNLAGMNYLSLSNQQITATAINLFSHVTGNLPIGNLAGGVGASSSTFWRGDGTWSLPPAGGGGSGGDNFAVNGVNFDSLNFNDIAPGPPANGMNIRWQALGVSASANIDTTFLRAFALRTDLHSPVTLSGQTYLSLSGQQITASPISLSSHVTGNLPVSNLNGGAGANANTFWRGNGTWGNTFEADTNRVNGVIVSNPDFNSAATGIPAGSMNVTFRTSGPNVSAHFDTTIFARDANLHPPVTFTGQTYLSLTGQLITASPVNLSTHVTGNLQTTSLNGGTNANINTFWRGNGTWATPPFEADTNRVNGVNIASPNFSNTLPAIAANQARVLFTATQPNIAAGLDTTFLRAFALRTDLHSPVTLSGQTYLSLSGQQITANSVNLSGTHVTGNLPVARLNSGTGADASTFWRGDGTWSVPPSGGGSGGGDNFAINGANFDTLNFNDTTPAAPANGINIRWQATGAQASANLDTTFLRSFALRTDLHAPVTLAGQTYLSLSGQQITASPINLAGANVTGNLPVTHLNGGTNAFNNTFWRGDGTWQSSLTLEINTDALLGITGTELTLDTQGANQIFSGPASGGLDFPTFRSLVDADIPAAIARDAELHAPVTLGGVPDYLSLSGQQIIRDPINLTAHVTGNVSVSNFNNGVNANAGTFWRGDATWTPSFVLAGATYLSAVGQTITAANINLASQVTGNLPVTNLNSGTGATSSTFWRGDGTWQAPPAGGGAPIDASYLVGAADGTLTNEIVAGANPGGALGGTWGSPTVDNDGHSHTGATISGLDVSDDLNLIGGDDLTLVGDQLNVDDSFVRNSGDVITGNLNHSDGVGDSPPATFTPQSGTSWEQFTEDATDDFQLRSASTAAVEEIDITNPGAGTVNLNVEGNIIPTGTVDGVDVSARDHNAVTIAGETYATLSLQQITFNDVSLATNVTGNLPVANLNGGTGAGTGTFWRGDGAWQPSFALAGENYLSAVGQTITAADISLTTNVAGTLPTANGGTGQNSTATFPTSGIVTTDAGTSTFTNKIYDTQGTGNAFADIVEIDLSPAAWARQSASGDSGFVGTNSRKWSVKLDDTADEIYTTSFVLPSYVNSATTFEMEIRWYSAAATTGSASFGLAESDVAAGANFDPALSAITYTQTTTSGTAGNLNVSTITMASPGWAAGETVALYFRRDADGTGGTDSLVGDSIWIGGKGKITVAK